MTKIVKKFGWVLVGVLAFSGFTGTLSYADKNATKDITIEKPEVENASDPHYSGPYYDITKLTGDVKFQIGTWLDPRSLYQLSCFYEEAREGSSAPLRRTSEMMERYKTGSMLERLNKHGIEGIGIEHLPGGEFIMGSPPEEERPPEEDDEDNFVGRAEYTERQHKVSVSPFRTMDTHLTRLQWHQMTGKNPDFTGCPNVSEEERRNWLNHPNFPVTCISWNDVDGLIKHLATIGIKARFLTEAEAEYLARLKGDERKITGTAFPFVGGKLEDHAWYGTGLHDVKTRAAASKGIYDARGNVDTWTGDWYGEYPTEFIKDYKGPKEGTHRVTRGGQHHSDPEDLRSAARTKWEPSERAPSVSIRLAFE